MGATRRVRLTVERVKAAGCPATRAESVLWDAEVKGLGLRVYPTGRKTWILYYRVGGGRGGTQRKMTLGDFDALGLDAARKAARRRLGDVAGGGDPAAEKIAKRRQTRLAETLDAYALDLERRAVVRRKEVMAVLRRGLLEPLGNIALVDLDRAAVLRRIDAIRNAGRPGAAGYFRRATAAFLNWCANTHRVPVSPLAGYREPRATKAERMARSGRALEAWELPLVWRAAERMGWPFGPYVLTLLLLGQRRTETAAIRWDDLDLAAAVWTIPGLITKAGRTHEVPLPPPALQLIGNSPRFAGSPYVFAGTRGGPMLGWSKLKARLDAEVIRLRAEVRLGRASAAGEEPMPGDELAPWTLHDLRRTVRTGLAELGIEETVAERILNHAPQDELEATYDRSRRWRQRVDALTRWSSYVRGLVNAAPAADTVVEFGRRRRRM